MFNLNIKQKTITLFKSFCSKIMKWYTKIKNINPSVILNFLTLILIIVTIISIIATQRITDVSLSLEKIREVEKLSLQIEQVDKLIIELENNLGTARELYNQIDTYKNNTLIPNTKFFVTRINSVPEITTNLDKDLVNEIENYKLLFEMILNNIENIKNNNPDPSYKNDAIDRTQQNLDVLINGGRVNNVNIIKGLPHLIEGLEQHKSKLEKKLTELEKDNEI